MKYIFCRVIPAILLFSVLSCFGPRIGYLVVPVTAGADAKPSNEDLRIAMMDTVPDYMELRQSNGTISVISSFRKSVADALFLGYRKAFPRAQITQVPLDEGFELIVWGAKPQYVSGVPVLSWRAEFLMDGKVIGELTADDIRGEESATLEQALIGAIGNGVERTYTGHMAALKLALKPALPEKHFLPRGKIFTVNPQGLVVSVRPDYPARSGQVFHIVDARQKTIGHLKVGTVFHTNFKAELLDGVAQKGNEVGVFVH